MFSETFTNVMSIIVSGILKQTFLAFSPVQTSGLVNTPHCIFFSEIAKKDKTTWQSFIYFYVLLFLKTSPVRKNILQTPSFFTVVCVVGEASPLKVCSAYWHNVGGWSFRGNRGGFYWWLFYIQYIIMNMFKNANLKWNVARGGRSGPVGWPRDSDSTVCRWCGPVGVSVSEVLQSRVRSGRDEDQHLQIGGRCPQLKRGDLSSPCWK